MARSCLASPRGPYPCGSRAPRVSAGTLFLWLADASRLRGTLSGVALSRLPLSYCAALNDLLLTALLSSQRLHGLPARLPRRGLLPASLHPWLSHPGPSLQPLVPRDFVRVLFLSKCADSRNGLLGCKLCSWASLFLRWRCVPAQVSSWVSQWWLPVACCTGVSF